ncbi:MAG: hypothetical protein J7M38_03005 [Armatimonadetes bacterium]|nr:hypothetical protein [Armatimonadota bacterium]
MMCEQVREQLVECWGAQEALSAEALAHIRQCPECRREAELLRGTRRLLGQIEPVRAPAGFTERVMAEVARTPQQDRSWQERIGELLWPQGHTPAWGRALAVAALLMVLISGFALLHGLGGAPAMQPQPASIIADGGGAGALTVANDEDLEALMLRHEALELNQALSDDAGVHLIAYTY